MREIAERCFVETGDIHDAAAGEFVNDLVDIANLIGGVGAVGQKLSEDFLGSIAVEAYQGADEQAKPIALLSRPLDRLLGADSMGEQEAL